ncbi:MAG: ribosomal protein S18-alanine N-acetyltransferase [Gammaproteobacteria bacterium]|jgi:ribosomal-protein-alanine N-acetyltransferase
MFVISKNADSHISITLQENHVVIGTAVISIVLDEAEILDIKINPEKRHQGYGAQLMQFLLKFAAEQKVKKIFLEVRVSNKIAIKLYQKFGFKQIAIRKDYYKTKTGREDALVLVLRLTRYFAN